LQELPPNVKPEGLADNNWNCSMINWDNPTIEPCSSQSVTNGTSRRQHKMEGMRLFDDGSSMLCGSFDETTRRLSASDEDWDDGENSKSATEKRETILHNSSDDQPSAINSPDNESFVPCSIKEIVKKADEKLEDTLRSDSPTKKITASSNSHDDYNYDDEEDDGKDDGNLEKLKKELQDADTSLKRNV
jgi:hypothetical protein